MPQPSEDPAFDQQHSGLDLGLVAGLAWPRRQYGGAAVMLGERLIGAVRFRLVAVGNALGLSGTSSAGTPPA